MHITRCLFIDPMPGFRYLAQATIELNKWPIKAVYFSTPLEAMHYMRSVSAEEFPDAIMAELRLPFFNGVELAYRFRQEFGDRFPCTRFYLNTCQGNCQEIKRLEQLPLIDGMLQKPFGESGFEKLMAGIKAFEGLRARA